MLPIDLLVSGTFPVEQAVDVYNGLDDHSLTGIGYLFEANDIEAQEAPAEPAPAEPAAAEAVVAEETVAV